jgi:hypothetical protein
MPCAMPSTARRSNRSPRRTKVPTRPSRKPAVPSHHARSRSSCRRPSRSPLCSIHRP